MNDAKAAPLPRQTAKPLLRWMAGSVLAITAAVAATLAQPAHAEGQRPDAHAQGDHAAHARGHHGPEAGEAHGRAPMMMSMFAGSPEYIARGVDRLLDGLNASDAQRTQIKQIATTAAAELRAQRESGRGLRDQSLQVFTAPTLDPAAAEALRQQMNAQHDQASKRTLQAMLDVARVLTPEQRAKVGARMADRSAVMKDRMQRMHHEPGRDHARGPMHDSMRDPMREHSRDAAREPGREPPREAPRDAPPREPARP
jgi:periplasmic protein CpxP/Spy